MTLFLAVFIPIAILGFLYLFIIENNGLPDWMERASRSDGSKLYTNKQEKMDHNQFNG
jgi:hypothetical protein